MTKEEYKVKVTELKNDVKKAEQKVKKIKDDISTKYTELGLAKTRLKEQKQEMKLFLKTTKPE
ncbi:hypothetical protein [Spiroplasma endosymbiont of Labia minor]|uniref:hypothetical protein n=1 Tax=Spiroplasma endosymbiont of Labia minor TaxID=3066305 RepID=UPI0030D00B7A